MSNWFNTVNVKIYLAQQMTGIREDKIYNYNLAMTKALEKHGITVFSPVTEEGVKPSNKQLNQVSQDQLNYFWERDKYLIRHSHLLLDITGPSKSQGLLHEIGLSRYFLFKPVVRIIQNLGPSVAIAEDDLIVNDVEEAAKFIIDSFGTPKKRLLWKIKLFARCFLPYLRTRFNWCIDWI